MLIRISNFAPPLSSVVPVEDCFKKKIDKVATLATIAFMITTTFTAKEAKNNFGRLLDEARRFPVAVLKNGRRVAVVMSSDEYDEFETKRDAYWGRLAGHAHKNGYIGRAKSMKILKAALDA